MYTPNLRQLEVFLLLMKTRSLTETARLMYVTQPSVSQTLRELENQIGIELFYRRSGRIRPTEEAMILLPEVERLFSQVGSFAFRANELRDTLGGKIAVACVPVLSGRSLPLSIERMLKVRPRLNITLQSVTTSEVLQLVKSETVELGFVFGPITEGGIGIEPILETQFAYMIPRDHPLASRERLTAADLKGQQLIVLSPMTPPGLLLRDALRRHNADNLVQVTTNSAYAALSLLRTTGMIAIIDPFPILDLATEDIVIRPFEPAIKMTVAVTFSRHRAIPKIALQFVKEARAVLSEQAARLNELGIPTRML